MRDSKPLFPSFPWVRYSKALICAIEKPSCVGYFAKDASAERGMHLAEGRAGSRHQGNAVELFWLVDPTDGVIVDAKFQVFGQSALIGAGEAACLICVGKTIQQAKRITADLLDRSLRDKSDQPAFPPETFVHLNLVLEAIDAACETCIHLTSSQHPPATPLPAEEKPVGDYPDWEALSHPEKMALLEEILARDIRPYIELDAGGVALIRLEGWEVHIMYSGSCTSCFSATGATLSYIQQHFRSHVHPSLIVVPHL